jgi:hypothetical protein
MPHTLVLPNSVVGGRLGRQACGCSSIPFRDQGDVAGIRAYGGAR